MGPEMGRWQPSRQRERSRARIAPCGRAWAARETEGLVQMGFALSLAAWCLETATRRGQRLYTGAR